MTTIASINIIKRTILKKKSYNLGEKDIPLLNLIIEEIQSKNKKNKNNENNKYNQIMNISEYVIKILEISTILYQTLK